MTTIRQIFQGTRNLLLYGAVMAVLIFVLKWLQWKYIMVAFVSALILKKKPGVPATA